MSSREDQLEAFVAMFITLHNRKELEMSNPVVNDVVEGAKTLLHWQGHPKSENEPHGKGNPSDIWEEPDQRLPAMTWKFVGVPKEREGDALDAVRYALQLLDERGLTVQDAVDNVLKRYRPIQEAADAMMKGE